MSKKYLIGVILFFIMFISACTSSAGHKVLISSNSIAQQAVQQSSGLERGQIPPDFVVADIDGKQVKLSQFRDKKPYPLILSIISSILIYVSIFILISNLLYYISLIGLIVAPIWNFYREF